MVWIILINVNNEAITFLLKKQKVVFWNNVSFAAAAVPSWAVLIWEYIMKMLRKELPKLRRDIAFLGSVLKETNYFLLSLFPKGCLS